MSVQVVIVDGPLPPSTDRPAEPTPRGDLGAVVLFEGIVRGVESGRGITALDYEVYEPMAHREIEKLANHLVAAHKLHGIRVEHSRGRVPVGACSFRLIVIAAHRGPAFRAAMEFIDRLKQDIPIWKSPVPG
jgi:molybdopterin synthase catalytic subunit